MPLLFTYTPSKHFADSKEDNVELKNKIRTYIKYAIIKHYVQVLIHKKVFSLVNSIARKYRISESKIVGLTVYVWNWDFLKLQKTSIEAM